MYYNASAPLMSIKIFALKYVFFPKFGKKAAVSFQPIVENTVDNHKISCRIYYLNKKIIKYFYIF